MSENKNEIKKGQIMLVASWREVFDTMPNEQIGELIKAMYAYQFDNKEPQISKPELVYFWVVVKNWLDDNSNHYQEVCRKRKEAVTNRWNKQKEKEKQKEKQAAMKPEERLAHELVQKIKIDGEPITNNISVTGMETISESIKSAFSKWDRERGKQLPMTDDNIKSARKQINYVSKLIADNDDYFDDCMYEDELYNYDKVVMQLCDAIEADYDE